MFEQPWQQFVWWFIKIILCVGFLVYTFVWSPIIIRRTWKNKKKPTKQEEEEVKISLTINYLFVIYFVLLTTLPYMHESYQAWAMELGWKIQT